MCKRFLALVLMVPIFLTGAVEAYDLPGSERISVSITSPEHTRLQLIANRYLPSQQDSPKNHHQNISECLHTIILVHGMVSDQKAMDGLVSILTALGFVVVTYDQLGVGESSRRRVKARNYSIQSDARHLLEVARKTTTCGPISLIGHSYGTVIVLEVLSSPELAERYSEILGRIESAALLAPPSPHMMELPPSILRLTNLTFAEIWLGYVLGEFRRIYKRGISTMSYCNPEIANNDDWRRQRQLLRLGTFRANKNRARSLAAALESRNAWLERLRRVKTTVLVISGKQDALVPSVYAKRLYHTLPNAWHFEVSEVRHSLYREKETQIGFLMGGFISARGVGYPRENLAERYGACPPPRAPKDRLSDYSITVVGKAVNSLVQSDVVVRTD